MKHGNISNQSAKVLAVDIGTLIDENDMKRLYRRNKEVNLKKVAGAFMARLFINCNLYLWIEKPVCKKTLDKIPHNDTIICPKKLLNKMLNEYRVEEFYSTNEELRRYAKEKFVTSENFDDRLLY